MKLRLLSLSIFLASAGHLPAETETSGAIALGTYCGYADMFAIRNGVYILDNGCSPVGVECELVVLKDGISFNTGFYKWDAVGVQASRTTENGEFERINIQGKSGRVITADLVTEKPRGEKTSLIRRNVAPKE